MEERHKSLSKLAGLTSKDYEAAAARAGEILLPGDRTLLVAAPCDSKPLLLRRSKSGFLYFILGRSSVCFKITCKRKGVFMLLFSDRQGSRQGAYEPCFIRCLFADAQVPIESS